MRPPRRPCRQHFPDEAIGLFKCINEAESHICTGFVCVILDRKGDILPRFGARYDRFCSHDPARCVTRSRRPWKYPASTGAVGVELATSRRSEEHTPGLESLMRIWQPVACLARQTPALQASRARI